MRIWKASSRTAPGPETTPAKLPAGQFEKGQPAELVVRFVARHPVLLPVSLPRRVIGPALPRPEYTFHTQRPPGSAFMFTVTADSHLDEHTDCDLYTRTCQRPGRSSRLPHRPRRHVHDRKTRQPRAAARQYLAQRYYLGLVGTCPRLFLVLGNHDGEDGAG